MKDLTTGSIPKHIVTLAVPMSIGMIFQSLYHLVDVYFVGLVGEEALAGLSAGGNVQFLLMALTQTVSIGTMALVAQASGRKDRSGANLVFNQSMGLAIGCGLLTLAVGYALTDWYMGTLGADGQTTSEGAVYLRWFMPGLALQFTLLSMGGALRGTGNVKPPIAAQVIGVTLNAILAPVMIVGWGVPGDGMGVLGAGLSSTISIAVANGVLLVYFARGDRFVGFNRALMPPRLGRLWSILRIGLPAGGEFALIFVYMGTVYWSIRGFGAEAQAAFGIGSRVMQAILLPAMGIAFATGPVAGQNFGARRADRVGRTFRWALLYGTGIMLGLTALCRLAPGVLIGIFSDDPGVIAIGSEFLAIIALNFVAISFIFTCNGILQGLGNTLPSLAASGMRVTAFAALAVWSSGREWFSLPLLWYLSVGTYVFHTGAIGLALRRAFRAAVEAMAEGGGDGAEGATEVGAGADAAGAEPVGGAEGAGDAAEAEPGGGA